MIIEISLFLHYQWTYHVRLICLHWNQEQIDANWLSSLLAKKEWILLAAARLFGVLSPLWGCDDDSAPRLSDKALTNLAACHWAPIFSHDQELNGSTSVEGAHRCLLVCSRQRWHPACSRAAACVALWLFAAFGNQNLLVTHLPQCLGQGFGTSDMNPS